MLKNAIGANGMLFAEGIRAADFELNFKMYANDKSYQATNGIDRLLTLIHYAIVGCNIAPIRSQGDNPING